MEPSKPWDNIQFYRTNKMVEFELESGQVKHIKIEQEIILHKYRNRINEYEKNLSPHTNWEYYKKVVNPYELVYTQKKYDNFPDSIYSLKPLSRSYFKMIEILDLIRFFTYNDQVKSAHVCEGPGGFIEALFDEASKKKKKIKMSIAMTLK